MQKASQQRKKYLDAKIKQQLSRDENREETDGRVGTMVGEQPDQDGGAETALGDQTVDGERHKCSYCDKAYTLQRTLNLHLTSHTGEPTYKCTECGRTFLKLNSLTRHMTIHNAPKRQLHQCCVCGQIIFL